MAFSKLTSLFASPCLRHAQMLLSEGKCFEIRVKALSFTFSYGQKRIFFHVWKASQRRKKLKLVAFPCYFKPCERSTTSERAFIRTMTSRREVDKRRELKMKEGTIRVTDQMKLVQGHGGAARNKTTGNRATHVISQVCHWIKTNRKVFSIKKLGRKHGGNSAVVKWSPPNWKVWCSIDSRWVNCRSVAWTRSFTSTGPANSTIQALSFRQLPSPN